MTTPRLVLDEARLERNIARMAERAATLGLRLRPHLKTHKCVEIMQRQLRAGAAGISVATVAEAEVFVDAGADDVLIAYPPAGGWRVERMAALGARARVIVACDRPEHVEALAAGAAAAGTTIEFYWEVDCGVGRLGTPPGAPTAEVLAPLLDRPSARLAGLMAFSGQAYRAETPEDLAAAAAAEGVALRESAAALRARGIDPGVLSGGSTPAIWQDAGKRGLDEYRPGNYVFYDATQVALGVARPEECALTVEATVVSVPAPDRVILDCGSKALPVERMTALLDGFGTVVGMPGLRLDALYEEHAICRATGPVDLAVGDVVAVVPGHACTCANLHGEYVVRRADGTETRWSAGARGWSEPDEGSMA